MAIARLTYAQLLSSVGDHRKAAHEFSHTIFLRSTKLLSGCDILVNYGIKAYSG